MEQIKYEEFIELHEFFFLFLTTRARSATSEGMLAVSFFFLVCVELFLRISR